MDLSFPKNEVINNKHQELPAHVLRKSQNHLFRFD